MKRVISLFSLFMVMVLGLSAQASFPPINRTHVIDAAGILSSGTEASLDYLIQQDEDTSGNQIMVLTIPNLNGQDIEGYANEAYNHYNLGQKGTNNGVLLVVSHEDRKVRIEVGYGLEGNLPDVLCGRIIDREIIPNFKTGNFDAGVTNGVHAILAAIQGTYVAPASSSGALPWWLPFLIIAGIMGFIVIMAILNGKNGGGGGGRYSGGGYYGGGWYGGGGWSSGGGGGWSGGGGGFSGGGGASGSW